MIEAHSLTKNYPQRVAVQDLSFCIKPGEVFCLFGANGAGKTTTLNMFLNFAIPSAGQALIGGIDANRQPLLAKQQLAFLSENVRLYDNFSAYQNVQFFAGLAMGQRISKASCQNALSRCGLEPEFHHQRLGSFSKGMRQKTGLAICLVRQARAIFLDEPLSGLDPTAAAQVLKVIRQLSDDGAAVFMATHDLWQTQRMADQCAVMTAGRLKLHLCKSQLQQLEQQQLLQLYQESVCES
jgi:ABC-2 type transport system ATP-binding protein